MTGCKCRRASRESAYLRSIWIRGIQNSEYRTFGEANSGVAAV